MSSSRPTQRHPLLLAAYKECILFCINYRAPGQTTTVDVSTGGETRREKSHAKLKKRAPHYSTSKLALTEGLGVLSRAALNQDGPAPSRTFIVSH